METVPNIAKHTEDSAASLAALVTIARAAHIARDRALERETKRQLQERYGVTLTFQREPTS
jgi:hypothetical protein